MSIKNIMLLLSMVSIGFLIFSFGNSYASFTPYVFHYQLGCPSGSCAVGTTNGTFGGPEGVSIDNASSILVSDTENHRVQKFNSTGAYLSQFHTLGVNNGTILGPRGVAFDIAGNIYVVDSANNQVEKFNSGGIFQSSFGAFGSGNGQFNGPRAIALDSSGNIYVVDGGNNRVQKFNSTFGYQSQLGCSSGTCTTGTGNGQFAGPRGITLDSSGNIYVTDGGNNRIQKFNSTGGFVTKFGSNGTGNGQFHLPIGITLDSLRNMYVVDSNNNRVQILNSTGAYQSQFGSLGTTGGQFEFPEGIALDISGNLYVVDTNNNRVEVFNPNCSPPNSGDWTIISSCTMPGSATASANVIVQAGSILTIPHGIHLNIDLVHHHLLVKSGGGVLIKNGGAIN